MTLIRGASLSKGIRYSTVLCPSSTVATIKTGSVSFAAQTNLPVVTNQRVRASVLGPVEDPSIFIEGPVTAYANGQITVNADNFGGVNGAIFSSWRLTASVDLTGGTLTGAMRADPDTYAGRQRTPISLTLTVTGNPKTGVFIIYLSPTQTGALALGNYTYKVLFTPANSSDKFLVLGGTIQVQDE
jgi:hypothetical protein